MPVHQTKTTPKLPEGRARLTGLLRAAGDVITIDQAATHLGQSRSQTSKILSRWVSQGWLRRIKAGTYIAAPLDALDRDQVLDDPFILVPHLFAPCYIGGRTAAHHWDLTEQLFRDVVVFTARPIRESSQTLHGIPFTLYRIQEDKIFGVKVIWRGRTRVSISDVHRTIIDMLDNPEVGGGIQHVNDCLITYLQGKEYNRDLLIGYADHLGNGAVFKRLGYLVECLKGDVRLIEDCRERLTTGNAKLDPSLPCPSLITKWRLFVPASWSGRAQS